MIVSKIVRKPERRSTIYFFMMDRRLRRGYHTMGILLGNDKRCYSSLPNHAWKICSTSFWVGLSLGVPVEHEMEKQLGFHNRDDIEKYGIQNFVNRVVVLCSNILPNGKKR